MCVWGGGFTVIVHVVEVGSKIVVQVCYEYYGGFRIYSDCVKGVLDSFYTLFVCSCCARIGVEPYYNCVFVIFLVG